MSIDIKYIAKIAGGLTTAVGAGNGIYYLSRGKTMEQEFLSQGKSLVKVEEGYDNIFDLFKDDGELVKLIGNHATSEFGGRALEQWCKKNSKISFI